MSTAPRSRCAQYLQLRVRDLLLLTLLVGLGLGWWIDRGKLARQLQLAAIEIQSRDGVIAQERRDHQQEQERIAGQCFDTLRLVERMARVLDRGDEWRIPGGSIAGLVLSIDRSQEEVELGFGEQDGIARGDVVTAWQPSPRGRTCAGLVRVFSVAKSTCVGHVLRGSLARRDLVVTWPHRVIFCGHDWPGRHETE